MRQTTVSIAAAFLILARSQARRTETRERVAFLPLRGGAVSQDDDDDDDAALDAYINELIASVDQEDNEVAMEVVEVKDDSEEGDIEKELEDADELDHQEHRDELTDTPSMTTEGEDEENDEHTPAATLDKDNQAQDSDVHANVNVLNDSDDADSVLHNTSFDFESSPAKSAEGSLQMQTKNSPARLSKKSKNRTKPSSAEKDAIVMEDETVESISDTSDNPTGVSAPPRPPNAAYRFLLNQGNIGHVVIMILVWISEFIQVFIPPLAVFFAWIASVLGPAALDGGRGGPYVAPKSVNEQYTGFVSNDGTSVRGKKNKVATKKADQKAMEQLRRIGSVNEARYRHVSVNFMKRHHIGQFFNSDEKRIISRSQDLDPALATASHKHHYDEEDEDISWVVEALTKTEPTMRKGGKRKVSNPIRTSVSLGSQGASVGIEFSIGGDTTKKSKAKRTSILEAATRPSGTSRKQLIRPKASDRDGGGGVMGRLRDLSSKNLMSRSIFGAYPGDAAPPNEAASAEGVIDLAQKYGYGDWSDDDDDNDSYRPLKRRRKKSGHPLPKTLRRRRPPSLAGPRASYSSDLDISPLPTDFSQNRSDSTRSPKNSIQDLIDSAKEKDILVRLPMERLREARRKLEGNDID